MGSLRFDGGLMLLHQWQVPLTVFCVVGVINALNMLDGLAGSVALVSAVALMTAVLLAEHSDAAQALGLFAACLGGFLTCNWRVPGWVRARALMGDAGSLLVVFVLAWFVVGLSQGEQPAVAPAQALWSMLHSADGRGTFIHLAQCAWRLVI